MGCKKYRICLMIFIFCLIVGGTVYYVWNEKKNPEPKNGILVQREIQENTIQGESRADV